jgi:Ca-activated chloride channel homolog
LTGGVADEGPSEVRRPFLVFPEPSSGVLGGTETALTLGSHTDVAALYELGQNLGLNWNCLDLGDWSSLRIPTLFLISENAPMLLNPRFTFEKVRFDQATDLHLVVSVTAPKSDWQTHRPPLCIIPAVDRSGSMIGMKMDYTKRSLTKLIDHLTAEDTFGLVSFATDSSIDFPAEKMTPDAKIRAKKVVAGYRVNGNTFLSGGFLKGLEVVSGLDLGDSTITRIILFTDGQPNMGVTTVEGISSIITQQRGRVSVSAFGYGPDANQELLNALSLAGAGNYAFIQDPDSALGAFGKELGGLLSTYAQDLIIELTPRDGNQLVEVLSDFDVEEIITGEAQVKIPHILSEETIDVVIKAKLASQKHPGPRQVNAVHAKLSYQILGSDGKMKLESVEGNAKVQFVKSGEEQKAPTKEVDELVARAQLLQVQNQAEAAAKRGDFNAAVMGFDSLGHDFEARGLIGVASASNNLRSKYASHQRYAQSAGSRMGLNRGLNRARAVSALADSDQEVLYGANIDFSNAAQEQVMRSFMEEPSVGGEVDLNSPPIAPKPEAPVMKSSLTKSRSNQW